MTGPAVIELNNHRSVSLRREYKWLIAYLTRLKCSALQTTQSTMGIDWVRNAPNSLLLLFAYIMIRPFPPLFSSLLMSLLPVLHLHRLHFLYIEFPLYFKSDLSKRVMGNRTTYPPNNRRRAERQRNILAPYAHDTPNPWLYHWRHAQIWRRILHAARHIDILSELFR